MTLNLDTRKYRLIKTIMDLNDEMSIGFLENQVEELEQKAKFWEAIKPIKKATTLEEMIAEQNYKPISAAAFFEQASAIEMNEPIEELLEMLD
jgi:hypothetical protein